MKTIKVLFQWMMALVLGFCMVNGLCFCYERPVGWIETPHGPSPAAWDPNTTLIHGTEGYGVLKVDGNGYVNPAGTLKNPHVLSMGSSHTQGKEVLAGENYTSLINDHFSKDGENLAVYNIACDANFFPSLIKHFPAAVSAFPHSSVVTVEISRFECTAEAIEAALDQAEYDEGQSAESQLRNFGLKDKLKMRIKEYFPLLSLIKTKLETPSQQGTVAEEEKSRDMSAVLEKALKRIRSQYDGEIIFIYHSQTYIERDGSISFAADETFDIFETLCSENDIRVLDMRPVFTEFYENQKGIPYGFSNTRPGTGTLTETDTVWLRKL